MDTSIDYSNYSLAELQQARQDINETEFPDRAKQLDVLIAEKQAAAMMADNKPTQFIRSDKVKFHGTGKEFFSIWIVNMLLTVLTLGIYSAWAKVRTNRYFYSNTDVDGHRFSYLAEPMQILKGRVIAAVLLVIFALSSNLSPVLFGILSLLLLVVSPFIIVQSLRFNMRMTSYRNVRFNFTGNYWQAFAFFTLYPLLSVFTLYLAFPWVLKKMDSFIVENSRWGDTKFIPELNTGDYYLASLATAALFMIVTFVMMLVFGVSFAAISDPSQAAEMTLTAVLMPLCYLLILLVSSSFYHSYIRNHIYNNSHLEETAVFKSEMHFGVLIWIRLSNFIAILFSLGLALPWTKVRTSKYIASITTVSVTSKADQTEVGEQNTATAVTDEVAGVFDIDVSLG